MKASRDRRGFCSSAWPVWLLISRLTLSLNDADRDDVHIKVSLAALLLTPLGDFWVPGRNEAKAFGSVGGIC